MRKLLNCYNKATADEWLGVMRHAHRAGLRTTATMMYGTVETMEERLEHLFRLRELQDETGGFTAFITWSYQPQHTELGGIEATGVEYLRTLAIARLVLDNFDNLQASWVTQGGKVGQLSLAYGANDMGSVMIEENVVRAAGAEYCMDEFEVVRNIENAGFVAKRRNMHYDILGDPMFRERDVPRMLELAVARADGAAARPTSCATTRRAAPRRARRRRADQTSTSRRPDAERLALIVRAALGAADRSAADRRRLDRDRRRPHRRRRPRHGRRSRRDDLGDVALLPGLVNAHTHLELSWLAGRVPPAGVDGRVDRDAHARRAAPARRAAASGDRAPRARPPRAMRATGTVLVGDISNTLLTPPLLAAAGLGGVVFHELLGFNAPDPAALVRDAWRGSSGRGAVASTPTAPLRRQRRRARAVLGVAGAVPGDRAPRRRAAPLVGASRPSRPRRSSSSRTGRGPMRATARDARRLDRRVARARRATRSSTSTDLGYLAARHARRARRAR